MKTPVHRIQCLCTAAARKEAADAGIELHFPFDARDVVPQVGDLVRVGAATTSPSRFVAEGEFRWEGTEGVARDPVLLLMLDVPDRQWGETLAEHRPTEIQNRSPGRVAGSAYRPVRSV